MSNTNRHEASVRRIAWEKNKLEQQLAKLATIKEGTPRHTKALEAIDVTKNFISTLESRLVVRGEKAQARAAQVAARTPRGPLKGEYFSVELGDDLVGYGDGVAA